MPNYLPYPDRRPSREYQDMLRAIRDTGTRVTTKQGEDALALAGYSMRFPMQHGAAVITERSIKGFAGKAIGELCAFINGARTLDELAEFGCDWWDAWATPEKCIPRGLEPGDLGPGSYGHAFRNFTTNLDDPDDPGFDQLPALIRKLKEPTTATRRPGRATRSRRATAGSTRSCSATSCTSSTTSARATPRSASRRTWPSTRRSA
jgi:thymidylate synthase